MNAKSLSPMALTPNSKTRHARKQSSNSNLSEIRQQVAELGRLSPVVTRAAHAKANQMKLNSQKAVSSYHYVRTRAFNENHQNSSQKRYNLRNSNLQNSTLHQSKITTSAVASGSVAKHTRSALATIVDGEQALSVRSHHLQIPTTTADLNCNRQTRSKK